jgi:CelD/BcsL family acetyltransferase involved in cellulose biosynthesis
MAGSESLTVSIVPIESALATLRDEWRLNSPDSIDDPTMSPAWLEVWWRHFGKPGTERVLCLLEPDGRKVGFLFTRLEADHFFGFPVRTVRCWVNSHAQRANLFLRCDADTAARAFAEYWVRNRQWDRLRLHGLPEGEFTDALVRHAGMLRCRCTTVRSWGHSRLKADQPWEKYRRAGLSGDTRRRFERQGRRLAELGTVVATNATLREPVTAGFKAFMDIETQSWKRAEGETIASDPALVAFYDDVVRTFSAAGMAEVTVLYLNEEPIAAALNLATRTRLVTLKSSFDQRLAKLSPGSQLFLHVTARAFNGGFQELDFYGKMSFTERWTRDERRFSDLLIEAPSVRSWLIGRAWAAKNRRSALRAPGSTNVG